MLIRAVAWDKRAISDWGLDLKPQEAASGWHAIKIVAGRCASRPPRWSNSTSLRGAIWKILEKQIHARTATAGWKHLPSPAGRGAGGEGLTTERTALTLTLSQGRGDRSTSPGRGDEVAVRTQQIDIQKTTVDLVKSIGPTDREERLAIKRVLNGLAFGDMLQAVARCDELVKLKTPERLARRPPDS